MSCAQEVGQWWFLMKTAADNSLSVIAEPNVLIARGASVDAGDKLTYFYNGKQFEGEVMDKNRCYDLLNEKLTLMCKGRKLKGEVSAPVIKALRSTRRADAAQAGPAKDRVKKPKTPEKKGKKSHDKSVESKKRAQTIANEKLIQQVVVPTDEDSPSYSSDSDVDQTKHTSARAKSSQALLNNMKRALAEDDDDEELEQIQCVEVTPDESAIEAQILQLQKKLKMMKEGSSSTQPSDHKAGQPKDNSDADAKVETGIKSDLSVSLNDSDFKPPGDEDEVILDDLDVEIVNLDYQLYGPTNDSKELAFGIHCKKSVLMDALTSSYAVTHLVRRLFVGVFKPSKVMDCTATGHSWNAGGADFKGKLMKQLHPTAVKAIIGYANAVAKKKGWKCKTAKALRPVLSSRLNEVKTQFSKGTLQDQ